ncbi:MAG: Fe-S-cluster containining protein [Pseudomonas sp.]|jgi:Fe-S-cluster containining protein
MLCRPGCGACCIAPSITSKIPGMPSGKRAGERCVQLDAENRCLIFGQPERPAVCLAFSADREVCGDTNAQALSQLQWLEQATLNCVSIS